MRSHKQIIANELNRIANSLESLSYTSILNLFCADDIANNVNEIESHLRNIANRQIDSYVKRGLSSICQNTYAENIRIEEIKEILAKAFPERFKGKKETT